jgi:hypothetical protein
VNIGAPEIIVVVVIIIVVLLAAWLWGRRGGVG